ncbi:MAG: hypothetical protein NC331_10575 [Lachnospiraceae bacterium]|nr:hypothetical protein [Lachnospiraceae bacterium]MCM1239815.1 hypothetical protein [Lachnospiraceae bacterium]
MKQKIRIHKAEANRGILDYSWLLDAPAGKHGFVSERGGHLYFADGTRARFLGFNMATRSATPTHETADRLAERFATMGVNIIRLHAADAPIGEEPCSWSQTREAPLLDYDSGSTMEFNRGGLDRFDYFAAKLKEKGIYLHIDLMVARRMIPGDGLDYPGSFQECVKMFPMINERLIQLQMEYARKLLTHVNPYTGLALVDDPAVVVIQMNNEESAIKGTGEVQGNPDLVPYEEEVVRKFNAFLLNKYDTREKLKEAWTSDGVCALGDDEDPAQNTVRRVQGGFVQPVNDPNGDWKGSDWMPSPARYADFMEFGIANNRRFYRRFKNFLISLGVRVPIAASNLLGGAADVYGHTDGDIMENNSYFNHPLLPFHGTTFTVAGPTEYVSVNPLTLQTGAGSIATTLLSLASEAVVDKKPFMITEWNEYGLHPFHSTAFVHTIAYACLNDWDGLILYNYQTSENWDDQPADEILNVFDSYNDPAVACQWGFMASMFLKGMVQTAKNKIDIVYTQDDLKTLPNWQAMNHTFVPYISSLRNVFIDGGSKYRGDGDVAVNAGFFNGGDLSEAKHGVYYAWSKYRDAFRRSEDKKRLTLAAQGAEEISEGIHQGAQQLVIDDISRLAGTGNYTEYAKVLDKALKTWGVWDGASGYVDGRLVSDTGEICFDPDQKRFAVSTPYCGYFSGAPAEETKLTDKISIHIQNERMSVSVMAKNAETLDTASEFILTAMGETGCDETTREPGQQMMGITFTNVTLKGKLFAETIEGVLRVKAKKARLEILNPIGEVIDAMDGMSDGEEVFFDLKETKGIMFHLSIG